MARLRIFANLETKIMALIMAIVLYIYAMSERSGEESLPRVPLYITLPAETTTLEKPPEYVVVNFTGPQKAIEKLREARTQIEARCVVDEKGHENDNQWTTSVPIDPERQITGVPREVTATKVEPEAIKLTIARTTTKELKVRLQLVGEPPPGFELSKSSPPSVYPGTITVTGPKTLLYRATQIDTEPISLSGLPPIADTIISGRKKVEQFVEVKEDNKVKRDPIDCNQSVEYWITLTQVKETLTLKKLPVKILTPPNFPYAARPSQSQETVDVELRGLKQNLAKLNPDSVKAFVDVTDKRPEKSNLPVILPVQFWLPEDVQGKVEVVNEPAKFIGVDITEPQPKEKGPAPRALELERGAPGTR